MAKTSVTLLRQILKAIGQQIMLSIIHGAEQWQGLNAMIAAILQASGCRGLFTSPHIMAVEESIQINRQLISKRSLSDYWRRSKPF